MKKIYTLCIALLCIITSASAQGLPSPWWSARVGVNFSNLSSEFYSTGYLTGYSVGLSYSHPISQYIPIYIESGLSLQQSGARDNGFITDAGEFSKLKSQQIVVPLLLGYDVYLNPEWDIEAAVGFYYSVALNGEFTIGSETFDPYREAMIQTLRDSEAREQQLLHRSDFGIRFGMSACYEGYLFGFIFNAGLLNVYTAPLRDVGYQALASSFTINIGKRF